MRLRILLVILAAGLLSSSALALIPILYAQPTWNFRVELLPSELYMGEWGTLKMNLTNMDCEVRSEPIVLRFEKITEQELAEFERRADEMREADKIKDYDVEYINFYSYQGRLKYDVDFTVYGACKGRSIKVLNALLWFPWKKYRGRDLGTLVHVDQVLQAFNPIDYILNGADPDSSTILTFKIFIPPDISPEEVDLRPYLDIRVDYPGWVEYTLEMYPTTGPFQIQPYRTFNLTVTDFDGVNVLAGAKLVIKRLVYYYEKREYLIPENGTIKIFRLKESDYEVTVYWNSSLYNQEKPYVYAGILSAYDLASSKTLKTWVFNVKLSLLDLKGRPLDGAEIIFDGVKKFSENGSAIYSMVPYGNHSMQIYWMGVPVLDEWVWVGYHPTIMPRVKAPFLKLTLPIGDLIVQAVDTGGNPIGANFTVRRLEGIVPEMKLYSKTGLLNLTQLPPGRYEVLATNCSSIFGRCVESSDVYEPGTISKIQLPVHSASFKILSSDEVPLPNATVNLGPISKRTDEEGSVTFAGIPEEKYDLKVFWKGVLVHDELIEISNPIHEDLFVEVYDINLEFRTMDGELFGVLWRLVDSSGEVHEFKSPINSLRVSLIPRGKCNLSLYLPNNVTILSKIFSAEELHSMKVLELPIKDMLVKVIWEGGDPLEKAEIILSGLGGSAFRGFTDLRGETVFRNMILSNYSLRVNYPYTTIPILSENITFSGEPIVITIRKAKLSVRVIDWFENPIPKAEVRVMSYGTQLARSHTGNDGFVVFPRLPMLPAYEVRVRYADIEKRDIAGPNGALTVKIDVIRIGGLTINVSDISAVIPYLVAVVITVIVVVAILLYRRAIRSKVST